MFYVVSVLMLFFSFFSWSQSSQNQKGAGKFLEDKYMYIKWKKITYIQKKISKEMQISSHATRSHTGLTFNSPFPWPACFAGKSGRKIQPISHPNWSFKKTHSSLL